MKKKLSVLLTLSVFFLAFAAYSHAVETITAKTVSVQEGDIIIYIQDAVEPDQPGYFYQVSLSFFQMAGKIAGVYDSYGDLKTWDDTNYPTGKRNFCGHAEIALSDCDYEIPKEWDIVVMRPTDLMRDLVNFDEVVQKAREILSEKISYNIPVVYVFVKWILKGVDWHNDTFFTREKEAHDIDFENIELKSAQYSPNLGTDVHNDIGNPEFWKRDVDCSGKATWLEVWYGYYKGAGGEEFREWLRDTPEGEALANATDCLAPGQLAWWLENCGLAEIVLIARYQPLFLPFIN